MSGVVAILTQVQPSNPSPLLPSHVIPKVPLQPLINSLSLAIYLVVVPCARGELSTNQFEELLPESSHEPAAPVTNYVFKKLVQPKYFSEEKLYNL